MVQHTFSALGSEMQVTVWDAPHSGRSLFVELERIAQAFEARFSRFRSDSLVCEIAKGSGTYEVGVDMVAMLRVYEMLYRMTSGTCTPAIGHALEDIGYDATYTLTPRAIVRDVPPLSEVLTILDDTHITLHDTVLFDFGALGKGYLVDRLFERVCEEGCARVLVNGSGDVRYEGNGVLMRCGLEHPLSPAQVIGVVELSSGALCASASNRRRWGTHTHFLNPHTKQSPQSILATWVRADNATLADAVATGLFLVEADALETLPVEYLLLNEDMQTKRSAGFDAELFVA